MSDYIIVEGNLNPESAFSKFKEDVNEKLVEGYIPLGAPVIAGPWIIQAMLNPTSKIPFSHFPNPNPLGGGC